jgi:hypothetical protein
MLIITRLILIIWCLLCVSPLVFAQTLSLPPQEPLNLQLKQTLASQTYLLGPTTKTTEPVQLEQEQNMSQKNSNRIFKELYNPPVVDEKKTLRAEWRKAFGLDVWYPYYQVKAVEDWVSDRLGVKVFKLKGRPEFKDNQLKYSFGTRF